MKCNPAPEQQEEAMPSQERPAKRQRLAGGTTSLASAAPRTTAPCASTTCAGTTCAGANRASPSPAERQHRPVPPLPGGAGLQPAGNGRCAG